MKKNKIPKYLIFISVITFISMFIFIVQKSYSNLMKPIRGAKDSSLTKPIDPDLDFDTLNQIEQRQEYQEYTQVTETP